MHHVDACAAAKLVVCSTDLAPVRLCLARMRHRENRRDREFMLGNSRMKLPDAMHAGQEFEGVADWLPVVPLWTGPTC